MDLCSQFWTVSLPHPGLRAELTEPSYLQMPLGAHPQWLSHPLLISLCLPLNHSVHTLQLPRQAKTSAGAGGALTFNQLMAGSGEAMAPGVSERLPELTACSNVFVPTLNGTGFMLLLGEAL